MSGRERERGRESERCTAIQFLRNIHEKNNEIISNLPCIEHTTEKRTWKTLRILPSEWQKKNFAVGATHNICFKPPRLYLSFAFLEALPSRSAGLEPEILYHIYGSVYFIQNRFVRIPVSSPRLMCTLLKQIFPSQQNTQSPERYWSFFFRLSRRFFRYRHFLCFKFRALDFPFFLQNIFSLLPFIFIYRWASLFAFFSFIFFSYNFMNNLITWFWMVFFSPLVICVCVVFTFSSFHSGGSHTKCLSLSHTISHHFN